MSAAQAAFAWLSGLLIIVGAGCALFLIERDHQSAAWLGISMIVIGISGYFTLLSMIFGDRGRAPAAE